MLSRPNPRLDTIPAAVLPLVVVLLAVIIVVLVVVDWALVAAVGLFLAVLVDFKADLSVNLVFFLVSLCAAADWFKRAAYTKRGDGRVEPMITCSNKIHWHIQDTETTLHTYTVQRYSIHTQIYT